MNTASTSTSPQWSVSKDYLKLTPAKLNSVENSVGEFVKDDALKQLAIDAIHGKVTEDCFNNLSVFTKAVAYDGFNPQTIILELVSKAAKDTKTGAEMFIFEADGVKYELPKKCDVARDVQMFAALFLVRGNNLFKILKTISKDAKTAISHKIAAYSLKSDDDADAVARRRKERVVLSSKDVTLSRIAASFPHITLAVAKKVNIMGKANCTAIKQQAILQGAGKPKYDMPVVLQHGMLPALLSKTQPAEEQELRQFCYMFNLEQTLTLQHPNIKKSMYNEPLANQIENSMKFVDAAINGPMMKDEDRFSLRKGLFSSTEDAVNYWVTAGSDAWIRASTSATYTSLMMMLTNEVGSLSPNREDDVTRK